MPLAAAVVGVTLLLLSPVLEDRAPVAAGVGADGARRGRRGAGPAARPAQLYPQGVVGLGAGAVLWLFGAQRTGLLAEAGRGASGADLGRPGTIEGPAMTALPLVFD